MAPASVVLDEDRAQRRTQILGLCVDAVCHVPFGSYPGNMASEYFSDEQHLTEWLTIDKDPEQLQAFIKKHILDQPDFAGYLKSCGAMDRMPELVKIERGEA